MDTTHTTYHPGACGRLDALDEARRAAAVPDLFNARMLGVLAVSASPEAWKTALEIAADCDAAEVANRTTPEPAPAYTPPF